MRLTCPNCDARYEVPDEVIPASGRDVQCSNCGQTWFQQHPDHTAEEEEINLLTDGETEDEDEEVAAPPPTPPEPKKPEPQRRRLDPNVADILRQEAEAEFEARKRRQSQPLESQPDLGLEDAQDHRAARAEPQDLQAGAEERAAAAKRRMARMRGETDAAAAVSSRRELLPDIDEINSTLRSDTAPSGLDASTREELGAGGEIKKQKRGFRRGFVLAMLIIAVLALVYVYAPEIAKRVPAADPTLSAYVTWVDKMRLALDGHLRTLLEWLDNVAASQSAD